MTCEVKINKSHTSVSHDSPKAVVFLAHGAGAGMEHAFMEKVTDLLVKQRIEVVRFNFPYMDKRKLDGKRRPPDRMPALLVHYLKVLESYLPSPIPVFIAGKSMGGRVAATLCSNDETNTELESMTNVRSQISGVLCLGYPFHPPKKFEKLRTGPLLHTLLPVNIIQGDRDTLGSFDDIQGYHLPPLCEVTYLADGDHDFKPRVKSGYTHNEHIQKAVETMVTFIDKVSMNK